MIKTYIIYIIYIKTWYNMIVTSGIRSSHGILYFWISNGLRTEDWIWSNLTTCDAGEARIPKTCQNPMGTFCLASWCWMQCDHYNFIQFHLGNSSGRHSSGDSAEKQMLISWHRRRELVWRIVWRKQLTAAWLQDTASLFGSTRQFLFYWPLNGRGDSQ